MNFDFKNLLIIFLLLFVFSISLNGISAESMDSNDFSNNDTNNLNEIIINESSSFTTSVNDIDLNKSNNITSNNTSESSNTTNISGCNNGVWMKADTNLKNVDLKALSDYGINNVFLNSGLFNNYNESYLQSWILKANSYGIKVHIWMQTFYSKGSWIDPTKNNVNSTFFNKKMEEVIKYASISGVSGIHLDYLRFPGNASKYKNGTESINTFVEELCSRLKSLYPNIIISAAVMPENIYSDKYYYGQDIVTLSKYLDVICPMVYKYNYKKTTSWIGSVISTFVKASVHAQIWAGLQTYETNDAETKVLGLESAKDLLTDCKTAINAGASGFVLFRYGLINYFDFKSVYSNKTTNTTNTTVKKVSLNDILKASVNVKNFISKNKRLPNTVTVGKYKVTIYQFSYLMSVAILNIKNNKKSNSITIKSISSIKNANYKINKKVTCTNYLKYTNSIYKYITSKGKLPSYVTIGNNKANFKAYTTAFAKILAFYKSNKYLPKTCVISS